MGHRPYKDYSQFGEDEAIARVLDSIGETNQWCVEIGGHDGRQLSNTLMFRDRGWECVLIEGDDRHSDALNSLDGSPHVILDYCTDLDLALSTTPCPRDLDFISIDVDGQDYWLWHDMEKYRPRVVCIEYNPYENTPNYSASRVVARGAVGQTAKAPLLELAEEKGYSHIATTYCNLIFVDKNVEAR